MQVITVRLDIAKSWFQAHGVNHRGQVCCARSSRAPIIPDGPRAVKPHQLQEA